MDPELLKRITVRRAELDELEEQLAEELVHVTTTPANTTLNHRTRN